MQCFDGVYMKAPIRFGRGGRYARHAAAVPAGAVQRPKTKQRELKSNPFIKARQRGLVNSRGEWRTNMMPSAPTNPRRALLTSARWHRSESEKDLFVEK